MKLHTLFPPILDLKSSGTPPRREVSALHSGNIGDVIYSLPTAYALGINHYILNAYVEGSFSLRVMTPEAACKLAPLLLDQGTIQRVSVIHSNLAWEHAPVQATEVDFIFDAFRNNPTEPSLHLVHRHSLAFGQQVRGERRWISSETCRPDDLPAGIERPYVVVGLTSRYRRWGDDYYVSLLRDIPSERVIFVGVEQDSPQKCNITGAYVKAADFKQLTRIISEASLFIGNPSFSYALAEGLKVPRLVELADGINVAPLDPSGLALHLYSQEFLRSRILASLGLHSSHFVVLADRIERHQDQLNSYQGRISQLKDEKQKLQNTVAMLHESITGVIASVSNLHETVATHAAKRENLATRIDRMHTVLSRPSLLARKLLRNAMHSNRWGQSVYVSLSRIEPFRRGWHRFWCR